MSIDELLGKLENGEGRGREVITLATRIEAAATIRALRELALKQFTVIEWAAGEGVLLREPYYDVDDLLCEAVPILGVETSEQARAALEVSHGRVG